MKVRAAFSLNLLAEGWSKGSLVVLRLASVPVLLHFMGIEDYGRWLVLTAFPGLLHMIDMGIGSVAANKVTMEAAAGRWDQVRVTYSTTFALVGLVILAGVILAGGVFFLVPWYQFLGLESSRHFEVATAALILGGNALIFLSTSVLGARFRAARRFHHLTLINSFRGWLDLFLLVAVLQFSNRFDILAAGVFVSAVIHVGVLQILSIRAAPNITFHPRSVKKREALALIGPGLGYQALPLGHALLFKGTLIVIQALLGPVAVALYGSARALVRSVCQIINSITFSAWPEMSLLIGAGEYQRAAKLHRVALLLSVGVAIAGTTALLLFGLPIFRIWTQDELPLTWSLLLLLVSAVLPNAIWFTSAVVHLASNQHEGMAVRYAVACGLALLLSLWLADVIGLNGVALACLLVDVVLLRYVLKKSLRIVRDTPIGLLKGWVNDVTEGKVVLKDWLFSRKTEPR